MLYSTFETTFRSSCLARPELGKVSLVLQGDNGADLPEKLLSIDVIQECLKDTAKTLPAGMYFGIIFGKIGDSYLGVSICMSYPVI